MKHVTPARVLLLLGVFAHGHATGHLLHGSWVGAMVAAVVGLAMFALALFVAE